MYESFFQLRTLPFKITPDDRIFFGGGQRSDMLQALLYAVERGEGLITVVGEVGTGKTTLARVLSGRLPEGVRLVSIFTPKVPATDMLYLICQQLELEVVPQSPKSVLIERLRAYLFAEQAQGRRVLLLIDEAQSMPQETLEELRLLSNLETNDFKLLQMILFAQPELEATLALPHMRQVRDRVVYQIRLQPFAENELGEYLAFRLKQAGYEGPVLFTDEVIHAIWEKTHGFPRAVNKLADHALMSAFARGSHQVTAEDVEKVSSNRNNVSYHTEPVEQQRKRRSVIAVFVVVGLFLFAGGILWLGQQTEPTVEDRLEASAASEPVDIPAQVEETNDSATAEQAEAKEALKVHNESLPASTMVAEPMDTHANEVVPFSETWPLGGDWATHRQQTLAALEKASAKGSFSLQLTSAPWQDRELFLKLAQTRLRILPEREAWLIDYVLADGRSRIALLYAVYYNISEAQQALNALPDALHKYSPMIVSIKQVIQLMRQSVASANEM